MKNYETKEFDSIFDEIKYEFKDLLELISYVLGQKSNKNDFINLLGDQDYNPANDNWPINETRNEKFNHSMFIG